jgi:hypothetical protein
MCHFCPASCIDQEGQSVKGKAGIPRVSMTASLHSQRIQKNPSLRYVFCWDIEPQEGAAER